MSAHSLPVERRSSAGATAIPDARFRRPRDERRSALIRLSWVRATAESVAPDLDGSHADDASGEGRLERAA
jgi:hypothetical protein